MNLSADDLSMLISVTLISGIIALTIWRVNKRGDYESQNNSINNIFFDS